MSRELKFRMWDESQKKYYYFKGIFNKQPFIEKSSFPQYESNPEYINGPIEQFTGLFTKSLKEETYDGDLIGTFNGIVLEICWSGISGQWRTRFYNTSVKGKDAGDLAERLNDGYMKVIGHIHEETPLAARSEE